MTDWYVSSAAYATIPVFQTGRVYNVGDFITPISPALKAKWAFRCTTAGISSTEPSWPTGDNNTITTGTAVFTNITGQSLYFWAAAAGDVPTLLGAVGPNRVSAGDRVFISSDHSENQISSTYYGANTSTGFGLMQFLCVNRGGSTPPVAADLTTGATCTVSDSGSPSLALRTVCNTYHYGIAYICTSSAFNAQITFGYSGDSTTKTNYLKNCQVNFNTTYDCRLWVFGRAILDNTSLSFSTLSQSIGLQCADLIWINTPNAILSSTLPTFLFDTGYNAGPSGSVIFRGVNLSTLWTNLLLTRNSATKILLDSCRISSSLTRSFSDQYASAAEQVHLYNCYDGTNIISEYYNTCGSVRTEFTVTLSGGAMDDVRPFSHKMATTTNVNKFISPLGGFWMDMQCIGTQTVQIATVEIVSSTTLKNDEIALFVEYEGIAGSSVTSFTDSCATPLTTPSPVTSSSATWNSLPSTPVRQKLQVRFTPRTSGRMRAQVRLGRPSTTVFYDPKISIAYA